MTFERALQAGRQRLANADIAEAAYEARLFLAAAAACSPGELIMLAEQGLPRPVLEVFETSLARREAREPLQHILGETEFYGLRLNCDSRALIPRPDSECVVDVALTHLPRGDAPLRIADLGTGSGCLLLALLTERPTALGVGLDQSANAVALATENAVRTGLAGRATFAAQSWASWIGWGDCDLIVSNPPYIASAVIETLAPEVKSFDPIDALDGGSDGLAAYREIIALAARNMTRGSHLVLEIGFDQRAPVSTLLKDAGFIDIKCGQDLAGQDRVLSSVAN